MSDLSILNVGHGDTKLSFDPANLKERARAKQIVKDMIALGYAICVKEGDRWVRVKKFDAEHGEYLIHVIAHLTLMRADENLYWRRCNQHPAWRPEAGL